MTMGILVFQHPILKAIILSQSGIHYMGITQGAKILSCIHFFVV